MTGSGHGLWLAVMLWFVAMGRSAAWAEDRLVPQLTTLQIMHTSTMFINAVKRWALNTWPSVLGLCSGLWAYCWRRRVIAVQALRQPGLTARPTCWVQLCLSHSPCMTCRLDVY